MKIRLALLLLVVVAAFAVPILARPVVIAGSQTIDSPDPASIVGDASRASSMTRRIS
jgi:hypothetical protein